MGEHTRAREEVSGSSAMAQIAAVLQLGRMARCFIQRGWVGERLSTKK